MDFEVVNLLEQFCGILMCIILWGIIFVNAPFLILFAVFYAFGLSGKEKGDKIVSSLYDKDFWIGWFYSPVTFPAFLGFKLKPKWMSKAVSQR